MTGQDLIRKLILIMTALLTYSSLALGEKNLALTHYGYAAYLGSGIYRTSDRTVKVYNIPMSYTARAVGESQWGINIKFPVTVGFYDFDPSDIVDSGLPDKVETFTLIPGLELIIPLRKNWKILPFLDYGFGRNFENDNTINIFAGGIRSLSDFDIGRKSTLTLSNRYYYVGQKEKNVQISSDFRALENGVSLNPRYKLSFFGRPADLHFHYVNFLYANLRFLRFRDEAFEIKMQNEAGFTFGLARQKPLKIFDIPRIGLGYRWGDKLRVIRLIIGAPY